MSRMLLSSLGACLAITGCTSSPAVSSHEAGHRVPSAQSSAPAMFHFEGETIAHAARAFNRYNRTQILIDDPAIADRKVGGTFVRTDPESFVTALGLTMSIQATTDEGDNRTIRLSGAETQR